MSLRTQSIQRFDQGVERLWKRLPEVVFWIFLVGSAAYLGRLGGTELWDRVIQGTPGTTSSQVFMVRNSADVWTAPGLTYVGITGAVLALVEAGAVLLGGLMLFARRLRMRIFGSMIVVAWAALWAANAAAFAAKSGGGMSWVMALGYALPLVAAAMVAMRRMGSSGRRRRGRDTRRRALPRFKRREIPGIPPPPEMLRGRLDEGPAKIKTGAAEPLVA